MESISEPLPCIGIMGEFSAGKSTLTNLLLGDTTLPEKITATELPPVWLKYGDPSIHRVDEQNEFIPISAEEMGSIDLNCTQYVQIKSRARVLSTFEIIDFPGISDPNMPQDMFERMLHVLTGVIWCTHGNQAWRQSEAAFFEDLPEPIKKNSILLVTRMDMISGDRDRARLLNRLASETNGLFRKICPVSLIKTGNADSSSDFEDTSGFLGFQKALGDLVHSPETSERPERISADKVINNSGLDQNRIMPRRVSLKRG